MINIHQIKLILINLSTLFIFNTKIVQRQNNLRKKVSNLNSKIRRSKIYLDIFISGGTILLIILLC